MKVRCIKIKNVRSFKEETVFEPREDYNVLIGSNGSGKSNLMDVIYVTLRHYFLRSYQQAKSRKENGLNVQLNYITDPCGKIERVLPKYAGSTGPSDIKITLEITKADIINLEQVFAHKEQLKSLMSTHSYNNTFPKDFLDRDYRELNEGQTFEYQVLDYKLQQTVDADATFYREYLNAIEGIFYAAKELNIELIPLMLYISPFRMANRDNLEVCLSSTGFNIERGEITKSTSRTTSSLIKLASLYFAEKHRDFEYSPEGYVRKWAVDEDVKIVTESLAQIGYSWDIKVIDRNTNTYVVQLKKDGREFLLNEASSGEVELINFILGLITLDLQGGVIIIDEPELHLHPQWLAILRDFFMKFSKERENQMMVVTHSPTFINSATYPYISRVFKGTDGASKIHQVAVENQKETKDRLHFINATDNEKIFFSDFVVMVEGDTDEIVFKRILSTIKQEAGFIENVEVMQIHGKSNFEKYSAFMKTLEIGSCFIGDLDNICEFSKGNGEIKNLLVTDEKRVVKDVLHNPASMDNAQLANFLKESIETGDREKLQSLYDHIISIRTKLKPGLTEEERGKLYYFIESLYPQNIYILKEGDIEVYFPEEYKRKDLDNVLEITGEKYGMWQQQDGFKALKRLMEMILHRNGILK